MTMLQSINLLTLKIKVILTSNETGVLASYKKHKRTVSLYWEFFTKFVENPIYQANISDENREKIFKEIHKLVSKLLAYKIDEE